MTDRSPKGRTMATALRVISEALLSEEHSETVFTSFTRKDTFKVGSCMRAAVFKLGLRHLLEVKFKETAIVLTKIKLPREMVYPPKEIVNE